MSEADEGRGYAYMLASVACFAVMGLLVKLGGRTLPSMQLVLARVVVTFVLGLWAVKRAGLHPLGNDRRLLFLRGFFGTAALCAFYYSLTSLPLGDATAIQYTNPVITALIGALVLGEGIRRSDVAGAVLSVAGVLLIARPGFIFGSASPLPAAGLAAASFAAVVSAGAYIAVRALRRTDHHLVVVFWFPLVAAPVVVPWAALVWVPPSPREWAIMLGVGVSTHIAQVFMTQGIHMVQAGRATAVGYLQVVLAFVIGVLVFGESPNVWNLSGAALIIAGTVLTTGFSVHRARQSRRRA